MREKYWWRKSPHKTDLEIITTMIGNLGKYNSSGEQINHPDPVIHRAVVYGHC